MDALPPQSTPSKFDLIYRELKRDFEASLAPRTAQAIFQLVPAHSGVSLAHASVRVRDLCDDVPWLRQDLVAYLPDLVDLDSALAKIQREQLPPLPRHSPGDANPIFRAATAKDRDHSLRCLLALLLSLSARYFALSQTNYTEDISLKSDLLKDSRPLSHAHKAITQVASTLCGYHRLERQQQLHTLLTRACGGSIAAASPPEPSTAVEYGQQLVQGLSDAPEVHARLTEHAPYILTALGIPPPRITRRRRKRGPKNELGEPQPLPVRVLPNSEIDPDEPASEADSQVTVLDTASQDVKDATLQSLKRQIRGNTRAQAIHHTNPWLCPDHVSVLSEAEAKLLIQTLHNSASNDLDAGEHNRAAHIGVILLQLATGFTTDRLATLTQSSDKSSTDGPRFDGDYSGISIPILRPKDAYAPPADVSKHLHATKDRWIMPLPRPLTKVCRKIASHLSTAATHAQSLTSTLHHILVDLRGIEGLDAVSLGRIRRTPAALLYRQSRDFSAVQTMLRDAFGPVDAPLYYYGSTTSRLRDTYRAAIWPLWREPPMKTAGSTEKPEWVGSAAVPKPELLTKLVRRISSPLQAGIPSSPGLSQIVRTHNLMAAHTATMVMAVSGHRPSESLFDITILDFDLVYKLAVYQDKQVDAAHMVRLAGIGSILARQLNAYLDHLTILQGFGCLPTQTHSLTRKAVHGKQPLFFLLDDKGRRLAGTLERIRQYWPETLRTFPSNFGRHLTGSYGRDLVENAELIHIQLGHYQACDYPFSMDSPLNPLDFAQKISSTIDDIAKMQGWRVRHGLATNVRPNDVDGYDWTVCGPLRRWSTLNARARSKAEEQTRKLRLAVRARQKSVRKEAEDLLVRCALSISPAAGELFKKHLPNADYTGANIPAYPLTEEQLGYSEILEEVESACRSALDIRIAALRAFRSALYAAAKAGEYDGSIPGLPYVGFQVDPTPFHASHMQTTRQIRLLRNNFRELDSSNSSKNKPMEQESLLGKTALGLAVYAGIDDANTLLEILNPDSVTLQLPAFRDSLLVWLPYSERVVALYQIAALAFHTWKRSQFSNDEWSGPEVSNALKRTLPKACLHARTDALKALLDTVRTANQIEDSQLSILALNPDLGSTDLPLDRLRDLLSHRQPAKADESTSKALSEPRFRLSACRTHELRTQYRELTSRWPNKDRDIRLPDTAEYIPVGKRSHPATAAKLRAEMIAVSKKEAFHPLIRLLASWMAVDICRPRRNGPGNISLSTSFDSLTVLAGRLITSYGEVRKRSANGDSNELATDDLEEIYLYLLDATPPHRLFNTLDSINLFHAHLVETHGFEPFDEALFYPYRQSAKASHRPRADFPLPREMHCVEEGLAQIEQAPDSYSIDGLIAAQSRICFDILATSGARIREVLGLTVRDVLLIDQEAGFVVRRTGYSRPKTLAAHRLIRLKNADGDRIKAISNQKVATIKLNPPRKQRSAFFLSTDDGSPTGYGRIASLLRTLVAENCAGRMTLHSLRHRIYTDWLSRLILGINLDNLHRLDAKSPVRALVLPWDIRPWLSQIGHGRMRVGIQSYFHLPWLFMLDRQFRAAHKLDRHAFSTAYSVSLSTADYHCAKGQYLAVAEALSGLPRAEKPDTESIENMSRPPAHGAQTARFCMALFRVARGLSEGEACQRYCLSGPEWQFISEANEYVASRSGIDIIGKTPKNARLSRFPKWTGHANELTILWGEVESIPVSDLLRSIITEWLADCSRRDRAFLIGSKRQIQNINQALSSTGWHAKARGGSGGIKRQYDITHETGSSGNHPWAFVLAIAAIALIARDELQAETSLSTEYPD